MGHRSWFTYVESKSEWEDFFSSIKERYAKRLYQSCYVTYLLAVAVEGPFPVGSIAIAWDGDGDSSLEYLPFYLRQQTHLLEGILKKFPHFHDPPNGPGNYGEIHIGRPKDGQWSPHTDNLPDIIEHNKVKKSEAQFIDDLYYRQYSDILYHEKFGDRVAIVHHEADAEFANRLGILMQSAPGVIDVDVVELPEAASLLTAMTERRSYANSWFLIISKANCRLPSITEEAKIAAKHVTRRDKVRVVPVVIEECDLDTSPDQLVAIQFNKHSATDSWPDLVRRLCRSDGFLAPIPSEKRFTFGLAAAPGGTRFRGHNQIWITHIDSKHEAAQFWQATEVHRNRYDLMNIPDADDDSENPPLMTESAFSIAWIDSFWIEEDEGNKLRLVIKWGCDGSSGLRALPYFLRQQTWPLDDYKERFPRSLLNVENKPDDFDSDEFVAKLKRLPDVAQTIDGKRKTEKTFLSAIYHRHYGDRSVFHQIGEQIFLSHSAKDKPVVRKIANSLRELGIIPWVDEAQLNAGESLILKLSESVRAADYLAVCLSSNSITSDWVQKEVEIAATQERATRRKKIIVLRLDDVSVPESLSDKPTIDFSTEKFEEAMERLEREIHPHGGSLAKVFSRAGMEVKIDDPLSVEEINRIAETPGIGFDEEGVLIVVDEELAAKSLGIDLDQLSKKLK